MIRLLQRVRFFTLFALCGLQGCGAQKSRPRAQIGEARELSPGVSGAERFELRCVARSECETQARRVCPQGYAVEREWSDSGTHGRPPLADQEEPGNADPYRSHNSDWGTQAHFGLLIECQSLEAQGE